MGHTLSHITKVEGHAQLDLKIKNGKLVKCELGAIEGSRYFEGLLKGRSYEDAPVITSRICGVCSSAHGIASVMTLENALGIHVSKQTINLRELQTIGERIRSHATHLYFLALPDYLGYESALAMGKRYKKEIKRALNLIKLGNEMVTLISGRAMHQVSTRIGGFGHFPTNNDIEKLKKKMKQSKKDILDTAQLIASLKVPDFKTETRFLSLAEDNDYATSHGYIKIGSSKFNPENYSMMLQEYHEPYSTANFVVKDDKSYIVGALARIHNNKKFLSKEAKSFMKKIKFEPDYNIFHNNLAQAIELIHYREKCVQVLDKLKVKHEKIKRIKFHAGHGVGANEAPRGTLFHEYKIDNKGRITYANVVTPTAQFLRNMQDDIAAYVQIMLDKEVSKHTIAHEVEKLIRAYDPCFSCATHFLKINWT